MIRLDKSGFSAAPLLVVFAMIAIAGGIYLTVQQKSEDNVLKVENKTTETKKEEPKKKEIKWSYEGEWKAFGGEPPVCNSPLAVASPIDTSKAVSVLYPGQVRGGQYKPHGGFRFANTEKTVGITIPLDAKLVKGSRYIEQGEEQILLVFVNDCGIMYRLDHLRDLTPEFRAYIDKLPAAKVDDSRTTDFSPAIEVKAGQKVATTVGFAKTKNISVDFGVYDLRQPNTAAEEEAFTKEHETDAETASYGICWLDILPSGDIARFKALPAADQKAGKTSDYCK